jgi:uncharacterized protein (DUF4213/DUF364 family)
MHYSTSKDLFEDLRARFTKIVIEKRILTENVEIHAAVLTPEEAIGTPGRTDYPILEGKELMLQAQYKESCGQVFTDSPAAFSGTIQDVLAMDIVNDRHARGLFIAVMNAVLRSLSLIEGTVHCRNDGMENCSAKIAEKLAADYGTPKITQIGYQPALVACLAQKFQLRVLDLNPKNIGKKIGSITVENGTDFGPAAAWADLLLCTGSTLANGSINNFLNLDKDVIFYGTTIAGAAKLLGLKRLCFESQ